MLFSKGGCTRGLIPSLTAPRGGVLNPSARIKYETGFSFEENFVSQGKMTIIFSNLNEINVTESTVISQGTSIGKTKKDAGNDIRIFILSDTDNLRFLNLWTNNKKVKVGDLWYWNPSFLFR
jgi:hypothetical protein